MAHKQHNFLYTSDQVRALDRLAIEQGGISSLQLMQRAGNAVFDYIVKHYPDTPITAKLAHDIAHQANVAMINFSKEIELKNGVVVDALLGTGLKDAVKGSYYNAIEIINKSNLAVVAVDLPSGLNADTGDVASICVKAVATISFNGLNKDYLPILDRTIAAILFLRACK